MMRRNFFHLFDVIRNRHCQSYIFFTSPSVSIFFPQESVNITISFVEFESFEY